MKVLTLNTWQERGPWRKRWELIVQGIRELKPDVAGFQEVFHQDFTREVRDRTDLSHLALTRESSGLVLLSRFPIQESESLTMKTQSPTEEYLRYALFAKLDVKGSSLCVFNTHLSWKLDEGSVRQSQAEDLLAFIEEKAGKAPVIAVGDFNAPPHTAEIRKMTEKGGFTDAYAARHPGDPGFTWNNENEYARDSGHPMPDRRIDYIFARGNLTGAAPGALKSVDIVLDRPDAGGVWPSDHFGLFAEFK